MTVTADMIAQVSSYEVAEAGPFTPALFTLYSGVAGARLARLDPGLDSDTYDLCHALLICHFYEVFKVVGSDLKSESIGDYSYTRAAGVGETSHIAQCLQIIADFQGGEVPNEAIETDDREMMTLDQNPMGYEEDYDT